MAFHPCPIRNTILTWTASAAVAATGWWGLLGWDTKRTLGADGNLHGPYDSWQVLALVALLAVLALWLGHRKSRFGGPAVAALTLTVCFAVSAEASPENDGLWPLGAGLVLIGTFVGLALGAFVSRRLEDRARRVP